MYVNGEESRPTRKASEKLRVASEERNIPNKRREKDFMSRYCWGVGSKYVVRRVERMGGRMLFRMAKMANTVGSICVH